MLQLEDGCARKYVVLIERHKINYKKVWLITDLNSRILVCMFDKEKLDSI